VGVNENLEGGACGDRWSRNPPWDIEGDWCTSQLSSYWMAFPEEKSTNDELPDHYHQGAQQKTPEHSDGKAHYIFSVSCQRSKTEQDGNHQMALRCHKPPLTYSNGGRTKFLAEREADGR
jgi:hypothetical protein